MPKTMLIDAYHREETRVAVLQGGKVEDFDFEYASRKPLRGNIYLARVTRVEPSLQAAFVEYGGNRHGFLAFGEIHPDYYQIPIADREILRKAEALEVELARKLAELSQDQDDDSFDPDEDDLRRESRRDDIQPDADAEGAEDEGDEPPAPRDFDPGSAERDDGEWHGADESLLEALGEPAGGDGEDDVERHAGGGDPASYADDDIDGEEEEEEEEGEERGNGPDAGRREALGIEDGGAVLRAGDGEDGADDLSASDAGETETALARGEPSDESGDVETRADDDSDEDTPGDDDDDDTAVEDEAAAKARQQEISQLRSRYEEAKRERNRLLRAYKIQEVIKRRQIMLVQVVKEERGNKGAALTTYLSLAGRYGVLMPNTARGGGISRKITSQSDRKRLKKAMSEMDIPKNMGLIVRTAGAKRTKVEIKRDYDYLIRLWETIRERTLESIAPALIYEEASLIKRAIRDLYDKDTEQIIVQGEAGYREAKDFMKMLMPSHAKFVQQHKAEIPIFLKYRVEEQLDQMYQPVVQLKSGGYIVIQQTEALVSIDVNSGKATKERNVEQTALRTNSEAAVEVARQCRLRDLAGLIVVDFIDMEENRNNRAVEKKLKEAMKNDRARTQIGSISTFGLLEMSRQRRRSGIVDGTTQACPVCEGAGHVRSHEMAALRILRAAEGEAAAGKHGLITVKTSMEVALYILNTKREWLQRLEGLYGVKANILADSSKFGDQYEVASSGMPAEAATLRDTVGDDGPLTDFEAPELAENDTASDGGDDEEESAAKSKRKRRRRRKRTPGSEERSDDASASSGDDSPSEEEDEDGEAEADAEASSGDTDADSDTKRKRRRRGRRGGRRNRKNSDEQVEANGAANDSVEAEASDDGAPAAEAPEREPAAAATGEERGEAPARPGAAAPSEAAAEPDDAAPSAGKHGDEAPLPDEEKAPAAEVAAQPEPEPEPDSRASREPRRGGWWQRAFQKN